MGSELLQDPHVSELADRCSAVAGIDLHRLLTEAADEELRLTANALPTLLSVGVALSRYRHRQGIRPHSAAGHSVGEDTALCVSGALSPEQAVSTVVERGKAMTEAAPPCTSSMTAVLGLDPE